MEKKTKVSSKISKNKDFGQVVELSTVTPDKNYGGKPANVSTTADMHNVSVTATSAFPRSKSPAKMSFLIKENTDFGQVIELRTSASQHYDDERAANLRKNYEDYEFQNAVNEKKCEYVLTLKTKKTGDGMGNKDARLRSKQTGTPDKNYGGKPANASQYTTTSQSTNEPKTKVLKKKSDDRLPCSNKNIENLFEKIVVPHCRVIENEVLNPSKEEDEDDEDISDAHLLKKHEKAEEKERANWINFIARFKKNKHPKAGNSRSNAAPKNNGSPNSNIRAGSLNKFSVATRGDKSKKEIATSSWHKIENEILFEKEDKDVTQDCTLQDNIHRAPNFIINENPDPSSSFARKVLNNQPFCLEKKDR